MNYYLAKCSELNFLICVQRGLWAQAKNRMSAWKPKDRLIIYAEDGILGLFEVTSNQFMDNTVVWVESHRSLSLILPDSTNGLSKLSFEGRCGIFTFRNSLTLLRNIGSVRVFVRGAFHANPDYALWYSWNTIFH
jgi:hypothetical protein